MLSRVLDYAEWMLLFLPTVPLWVAFAVLSLGITMVILFPLASNSP
jgi:hypothetical protein